MGRYRNFFLKRRNETFNEFYIFFHILKHRSYFLNNFWAPKRWAAVNLSVNEHCKDKKKWKNQGFFDENFWKNEKIFFEIFNFFPKKKIDLPEEHQSYPGKFLEYHMQVYKCRTHQFCKVGHLHKIRNLYTAPSDFTERKNFCGG